jgi:hypothetical protein
MPSIYVIYTPVSVTMYLAADVIIEGFTNYMLLKSSEITNATFNYLQAHLGSLVVHEGGQMTTLSIC